MTVWFFFNQNADLLTQINLFPLILPDRLLKPTAIIYEQQAVTVPWNA